MILIFIFLLLAFDVNFRNVINYQNLLYYKVLTFIVIFSLKFHPFVFIFLAVTNRAFGRGTELQDHGVG